MHCSARAQFKYVHCLQDHFDPSCSSGDLPIRSWGLGGDSTSDETLTDDGLRLRLQQK